MQIIQSGEVFDVVVVGSGATGGWMAKHLSEAGLKVAVLEAGPNVTPADYTEHLQPYDLKYRNFSPEVARNRPIQSMKGACEESNYHWFVDDIENPYTYPEGRKYQWTRGRMLGGRSLTWGRQSYRFSPMDLAPASRDGFGEDWPITYEELVPYYEKIERYVGISGSAEGLPQIPDSIMQPPMGMNCGEKHFQQRVEKALPKQRVFIGRAAVLTQDLNGRKGCHYCGPCDHGCVTGSYFASNWTTLPDAVKTGNCTIITDAVVSHVETDRNTGLARGVAYIDRLTRQPREIRAKAVALCASTLESTRILLNSGEGFCNSSGALGRYLMDHVTANTSSRLPVKEHAVWAGAPSRPNGLYIPRALNLDRPHTNGMIRGYGYQARHAIRYDNVSAIAARPGFGASFKKSVHSLDSYVFTLDSYNECLPRWENQATIDPHVRDAWGIPALHINATWSDNEMQLWHHSIAMAEEMHRAAGAEDIRLPKEPTLPGGKTHEVGTARMGKDPRKSVLNEWNQAHDVKNIYCTDGAAFVSVACQNPTLTMMALTVRAGDHIIERARRGEL